MPRVRRVIAWCAILLPVPLALEAQVAPDTEYRQLETRHFRVAYAAGLEPLARHAAVRAEVAWARLARTLVDPPSGPIDMVVTDDVDYTNGFATPLPSNRIYLYARAPVDTDALAYTTDWIDLIVSHELAHIFHLDVTGGLGRAIRSVFGRVPFTWPVFPAIGTPLWSIEGLAVQVESAFTGQGRIHGSWHEMIVRTAVLAGEPDPMDRVSGRSPIWPGEERVYVYGSMFMDWLARTYGDSVPSELVRGIGDTWLPPGFFFDRLARDLSGGRTFTQLYDVWLDELRTEYRALADSLVQAGLTPSFRLTSHGYRARYPRVGPNNRRISYAAQDGRRVLATRLLTVDEGEEIDAHRRNSIGPSAWLPSGRGLVTAQLEFAGRYRTYSDLYLFDLSGPQRRLTWGERVQEPDVSRDGTQIVAVRNDAGTTRVVVYPFDGRNVGLGRALTGRSVDVQWALPRFSPDGQHVAVVRWTRGGSNDIVILDTRGNVIREFGSAAAVDAAPAWSADGRWIIFSSDRSGIPNLFALRTDSAEAPIRQITNVIGGAFDPDVAPDGTFLVFTEYDADGFHLARIPFEPDRWPTVPGTAPAADTARAAIDSAGVRGDTAAVERAAPQVDTSAAAPPGPPGPSLTIYDAAELTLDVDSAVTAVGPYRAWPTLRPRYWLPVVFTESATGTFVGAATSGADLIGRHRYVAYASVAPANGRSIGSIDYEFAGLGEPVVALGVQRDWDVAGLVQLPDDRSANVLEREDVLYGELRFTRPRVRSSWNAMLGAELVRARRIIDAETDARLTDPVDLLSGPVARLGFANYRTQPFSISRENGTATSLTARRRREHDGGPVDRGYDELFGQSSAYRTLPLVPGFAHHVVALRASGLLRSGGGAQPASVGGAGGQASVEGVEVGPGNLLLPVRGFDRGTRAGTTAWTASAEYRFPLVLVGRGVGTFPLMLDRVSGALFVDAGDAWCNEIQADRFRTCSGTAANDPLLAIGAELNLDLAVRQAPLRARFGIAVPMSGVDGTPAFYIRIGPSF